jgi:hypothetical protein
MLTDSTSAQTASEKSPDPEWNSPKPIGCPRCGCGTRLWPLLMTAHVQPIQVRMVWLVIRRRGVTRAGDRPGWHHWCSKVRNSV